MQLTGFLGVSSTTLRWGYSRSHYDDGRWLSLELLSGHLPPSRALGCEYSITQITLHNANTTFRPWNKHFYRDIRRLAGDRWTPSQMASNAENVSIWWRHHVLSMMWAAWAFSITSLKVTSIMGMAWIIPASYCTEYNHRPPFTLVTATERHI